jgi:hypothetical protein
LYSGIYGAINFPVGSYPYAQKRYNKVVEWTREIRYWGNFIFLQINSQF